MPREGEWEIEEMPFVVCDKVFYDARILDESGDIAGHIGDARDARRIVTAVNCHEELVQRLGDLNRQFATAVLWAHAQYGNDTEKWPEWMTGCRGTIEFADALLAKAREGKEI